MDDRKKILLLYNANSGISTKNNFFDVIDYLSVHGYEVTVYPIEPKKGLTSEKILHDTKNRFGIVMVYGGDGTLNHAVNGLIREQLNVPVAYVPSGSTNDFSRSLYGDVSHESMNIARWITEGNTFTYDVGKFNDIYFNYVAGFGAFPMVSYTTPQHMKNSIGYAAYILNFLKSIPGGLSYSTHAVIEHDGIREEGNYMFGLITNSVSVGGVQPGLIKRSSLNDGYFEATLVRANLNALELPNVLNALNSSDPHSDDVTTFQMKHASFHFDKPVPWTLDGEDGGEEENVEMDVMPGAVTVFSPKESD